eukprot:57741_1
MDTNPNNTNTNHNSITNKFDKYRIDASLNSTSNKNKLDQMEILTPYKSGTVLNMECLAAIWMNTMRHNLRMTESQISCTPILLSEPSNWSKSSIYSSLFCKYREDYCRMIFEEFNCPAMYLCKDAVLSSFAHGKKSSIVFDFGAGSTRCTPVYDGYVINEGCKYTKCGGLYFDELLMEKLFPTKPCPPMKQSTGFLKLSMMSELRESVFRIRNTRFDVPNLGFPYKYNDSYVASHNTQFDAPFAMNPLVKQEENAVGFMENNSTTIKIEKQSSPVIKLEDVEMNKMDKKKECVYTLPDGQKIACGDWKYCVPELLFVDYDEGFRYDLEDEWIDQMVALNGQNTKMNLNKYNDRNYYQNTTQIWNDTAHKTFKFKGLTSMMLESLNGCDIDIRPLCARNVIISGGHSRYKGFVERLAKELSCAMPYSYKYKLHLNETPRERLFNTWLGGSILSSTTSFQSMWITKEEYTQHG